MFFPKFKTGFFGSHKGVTGTPRPARLTTNQSINFGSGQLNFKLVQSRLARHIHFKISPNQGLEVVVPYRFNLSRVPHLLQKKQDWIFENLKKMSRLAEQESFQKPKFADGMQIQTLGQSKTVHFIPRQNKTIKSKTGNPRIQETATEILIIYTGSPNPHIISHAKKILETHLKKIFKKHILQRTAQISQEMGTHYNRITIRAQKTRWGSCSRQNNLNFNWRLIFMPLAITDYIIIHELSHTVHHNHSKRFYALVENFCPDYKLLKKTLKIEQNKAPL